MSTWNRTLLAAACCLPLLAQPLLAQPLLAQEVALDPNTSVKIDLPADSPLTLVASNLGESRATTRGGAMVLDLHMSITLRNAGFRRVRGVTLLITAQESAPGGKGSVARPSIDVPPSQEFTIPVELRLLRPLQSGSGPLLQSHLVRVQLDGVLFDDLSFFGPNKLNSQRAMTVWETEAQRDRAYYRRVLQAKGEKGLRDEMLAALNRQSDRQKLESATNISPSAAEHVAQYAFLTVPHSPVEPMDASASGLDVVNRSGRAIRHIELGWIARDAEGHEVAVLTPPTTPVSLAPGQKSRVPRTGKPLDVPRLTGFVRQVEFGDGKVWVPTREDLSTSPLLRVLAPSPEEQRLADVYNKKGIAALMSDLNRY